MNSALIRLQGSKAAQAWLCKLATGFASGADLVLYLVNDRPQGVQIFEGERDADLLLGAWEQDGTLKRMGVQRLTLEQHINSGGQKGSRNNHFGWEPGPSYKIPQTYTEAP